MSGLRGHPQPWGCRRPWGVTKSSLLTLRVWLPLTVLEDSTLSDQDWLLLYLLVTQDHESSVIHGFLENIGAGVCPL